MAKEAPKPRWDRSSQDFRIISGHINQVTVVADRGMISKDTTKLVTEPEPAPFASVPGCQIRRQKEVNEAVLAREERYQQVEINLEVKEVRVGERRQVICRKPPEA